MRLVSWNVNGLRACVTKGFADTFRALDADIFCLQETKLQPGQITLELPGYHQYWCSAEKKGYSGTALFTKAEPLDVQYNLGLPQHDQEGRVIKEGEQVLIDNHTAIRYIGLCYEHWRKGISHGG